ncbi:MAG TPA: alanine racemase [bacterium]|nr:alanine racemase [bacterium]
MTSQATVRHRTYCEIDLSALRSNFGLLKAAIGPQRDILLVVKSDAYGHGAGTVAAVAAEFGISRFAVVSVDEGMALRRADVDGEIVLLHPPADTDLPAVTEWNLTPSISSEESALAYSRLAGSRVLPLHIEINTGLSRLGLDWESAADRIARIAALPNVRIAGLYTHYRAHYSASGDAIQEQTDRFRHVLDGLKQLGIDPGFRHAASSYPVAYHPVTAFDGIRVGIVAYGAMDPPPGPLAGIRPVMSVRSRILHQRRIQAGEWVHYGDGFQAPRAMTIAVIPIGYGMGYTRHLSNNGEMLIRGTRCPIVGVVGMDLTMVDVSHLDHAAIGDPVTVIGRDGQETITALELAKRAGTIAYEITCRLGNGLPRYIIHRHADAPVTAAASVESN